MSVEKPCIFFFFSCFTWTDSIFFLKFYIYIATCFLIRCTSEIFPRLTRSILLFQKIKMMQLRKDYHCLLRNSLLVDFHQYGLNRMILVTLLSGRMTLPKDSPSRAWSLRTSLHKNTIESGPLRTICRHIISSETRWGTIFRTNSEFGYTPYYWEWLEDVLYCSKNTLIKAQIFEAVLASLYTYDRNNDIIRAFCEAWCPDTNTLRTPLGEMSISLWDLHRLGGLANTGSFYDKVVPCYKEMAGCDEKGRFIPKSYEYLFTAFYRLHNEKERKPHVSVND